MRVKINITFFKGKDFGLSAITILVGGVNDGIQVAVCGLRAEVRTRYKSPPNTAQ